MSIPAATRPRMVPNHILLEEVRRQIHAGHTATIVLKGCSMRPYLEHLRDRVLLTPIPSEGVRCLDVVLAQTTDQRYVLHRVVRILPDGTYMLRGDGNVYGYEICTEQGIIGVAKGFYRGNPEQYTDCQSKTWRLYSVVWPRLRFMRRGLLWLYRKLNGWDWVKH